MPGSYVKRNKDLDMCFSNFIKPVAPATKNDSILKNSMVIDDCHIPILPGLPDDLSKHCLALVPRSKFPVMGAVCRHWRSFIKSKEFITFRKLVGRHEEWLYVLTKDAEKIQWQVLDCLGNSQRQLPPMPGPVRAGFGVVVLNGKILIVGGYSMVDGAQFISQDVYQYDSCLNSWSKLSGLNVGRYDFACAELNSLVYVVGGCGRDGEFLSSMEMHDPAIDKWTMVESLRCPRWGCFGSGVDGKLYIMGGRSSFTIGSSRFVDIYTPDTQQWCQMKNGCAMVTAHAVVGKTLYCMEWKNARKLVIVNPEDGSWKMVPVPVEGNRCIGFRFGTLEEKLLLFSLREDPDYQTLLYDPKAPPGFEWQISNIKPSGLCLCSVTIKV